MKDNLIPYSHSKELHDKCGGPSSLIMPAKMDHNDFDFCEDLITPFFHFLRQLGISCKEPISAHSQMMIPAEYFIIPKAYQHKEAQSSWGCYCIAPNNFNQRVSVTGGDDRQGNPVNNLNQSYNSLYGYGIEPRGSKYGSIVRDSYQIGNIHSIYGGRMSNNELARRSRDSLNFYKERR